MKDYIFISNIIPIMAENQPVGEFLSSPSVDDFHKRLSFIDSNLSLRSETPTNAHDEDVAPIFVDTRGSVSGLSGRRIVKIVLTGGIYCCSIQLL